jgi:hypothetical protein
MLAMLSVQLPLAQANASTIFYLTLLFIFLTAIITAVATKWARDKCLKFFQGYHVTLERNRGQTMWGRLKVFSAGIEVMYDHPYVDPRGRQKSSHMIYQPELEPQVLSIVRYHEDLSDEAKASRVAQVHKTFNPKFFRRLWRSFRNFVNTLRDAFNAAIGAAVTQFQRANPASAVLTTQGQAVTNIGQTLLGRFANAYEPLLEQYIGHPVILEVADPINPNNSVQEYPGYLADYTQQFIAVFNVDHKVAEQIAVSLPDVERGDPLPPLPNPPPPGAPAPVLPVPVKEERGVVVRLDGVRMKIQNTRGDVLAVRRLEKPGAEPLQLKMVLPPMATLNLPARDAQGATLVIDILDSVDVVAPRKYAAIRHAGMMLDRRGLTDQFQIQRLPLVSRLFADQAESDGANGRTGGGSHKGNGR